jgi:hypothetical protein
MRSQTSCLFCVSIILKSRYALFFIHKVNEKFEFVHFCCTVYVLDAVLHVKLHIERN